MHSYIEIYISEGEFEYKKSKGELYEGFVIGIGYAYITYLSLTSKYSLIGEPETFSLDIIGIQQLDVSQETLTMSFPEMAPEVPGIRQVIGGIGKDIRTGLFAISNPVLSWQIGEYKFGSNNISTTATRFSTRLDILKQPKNMLGEGTEVNAFRHTLWQSYLTNCYGIQIATQVGNAHEENPDADLKQRRFKSLTQADEVIDMLNNEIGYRIGNSPFRRGMKDMAIIVLNIFYKDGLYTAHQKEDGVWYVDRTKITTDQYNQLKTFYQQLNDLGRTIDEQEKKNKEEAEIERKAKEKLEQLQNTWGLMK